MMARLAAIALLAFLVLAIGCGTAPEQTVEEKLDGPRPGDEVVNLCEPRLSEGILFDASRADWMREHYIRWSPDGSRILFNGFATGVWGPVALYSVDPDGVLLRKVVNVPDYREARDPFGDDLQGTPVKQIVDVPGRDPVWGDGSSMMYFDISPDSSRIAYSTCAYTEIAEREVESDGWGYYREIVVSDIDGTKEAVRREGSSSWVYNYEIVVSDINGTDVQRLTKNIHFNNFPVWSPDGARIAFMSDTKPDYDVFRSVGDRFTIYTVATGKSEEVALPRGVAAYPHRLAWSPNGERIAFVAAVHGGDSPPWPPVVFTMTSDGSELTRISGAASGPAWSPDGQRIAVVVPVGEGEIDSGSFGPPRRDVDVALYTFAADGSDPVLAGNDLPEPWYFPVDPWMGNLSWSPDGSEILLNSFGYRVPLDGSPAAGDGPSDGITDAAWSPDGSKIAIRTYGNGSNGMVYIMNRDGANLRALVEVAEPYYENKVKLAQ